MTLIEVLAVVVILGLLVATLSVGISGSFGAAKQELARSGIGVLMSKVELYRLQHGHWPANDPGVAVLSQGHARPDEGYYLSPDHLIDPWGRAYLYLTPGPDGHPYEILCLGADGVPGGSGENADLTSVQLRREQR